MKYNLSTNEDRQAFAIKAKKLLASSSLVELKEVRIKTLSQNNYIHAILGCIALEMGYTLLEIKEEFKKQNKDIFYRYMKNIKRYYWRSFSSLTKEECSQCIHRLIILSTQNGITIPLPNNEKHITELLTHLSKNNQLLQANF